MSIVGSNSPGNAGFTAFLSQLGIAIGIAVVLMLLILLVRWWLDRRKTDRLFKEAKEFSERALELELRREKQVKAQQQLLKRLSEQPILTPEIASVAFGQTIITPLSCPHCQKPIQRGSTRCPYCGASLLAPTDSGPYSRVQFAIPPHVLPGRPNGIENQPVISNTSRCPNCSELVPNSPNYCPNCRLPLSSLISGPRVSVQPS